MSNVKAICPGWMSSHLKETEEELNSMTILEMELIQRLQSKQGAGESVQQARACPQHRQYRCRGPQVSGKKPVRGAGPAGRLKRPNTAGTPPPAAPPQDSGFDEPTDDRPVLPDRWTRPERVRSTDDLGKLLVSLGLNLSEDQLEQAKEQLDQGGTGQVSFGEFFLWWQG